MTPILTFGGMELLLRALKGEQLIFTHVAIGSGAPPANPKQATGLVTTQMMIDINAATIADGYVSLQCETTNAGLNAGFKVTEYGIFAQDMDDALSEVLYAYIIEDPATADYIPAAGVRSKEIKIAPTITVGEAENIAAIVNASVEYVPRTEFQYHVDADNNPHGVTKAQIGLGNVENYKVDDMPPTFTAASSANLNNLKLNSGNTLKTLFGKLKSVVELVITHLKSRANPHEVTYDQVGAAPAEHTHGSTGFTGTLPVSKGGTGHTQWDVGCVLVGNGNRLTSVYGRGAMYCDGEVGPSFGALPAEYGGTGLRELQGGVLVSDGSEISELDGEGAFFHAHGATAPEFGTLPVAAGGTGKNTDASYNQDLCDRVHSKGVPIMVNGSYTGNGSTTNPVKLEFAGEPKMIMVTRANTGNMTAAEEGAGFYAVKGTTKYLNLDITWGADYVSFVSNYSGSVSGTGAQLGMNSNGVTYNYIAII